MVLDGRGILWGGVGNRVFGNRGFEFEIRGDGRSFSSSAWACGVELVIDQGLRSF